MKNKYIITKTVSQIFLYLIEMVSVSMLFAYITTFVESTNTVFEYIERCMMCYTFYQILVIVILTNINDIARDSSLAYITNLKKCLLVY